MGKYELYENFFVRVGTNGNTDVILNFYEFLDVEPMAKKSEIFNAYQKKSSEFLKNIDIDLQEKQKERKTLDRVYSCLLYDDKNREIYDKKIAKIKEKNMSIYKKFFNAMKSYKIERTNREVKIKDSSDFKKKIIKIIAVTAALGIFAVGGASYINNTNDEHMLDEPTTSASEFYTDADVKMKTIEYLVEPGTNIGSAADIADELGVSKDQCIQVGNIKVGDEGVIFTVSVPEDVAEEYNSTKNKYITIQYKTIHGDYSENEIGKNLGISGNEIKIVGEYDMRAGETITLKIKDEGSNREKAEKYVYYNNSISEEDKQKLEEYDFYVAPGQDIKEVCLEAMEEDAFLKEAYDGDYYKLANAILTQNPDKAENYSNYQSGSYHFSIADSKSAKVTQDMLDRYEISLGDKAY